MLLRKQKLQATKMISGSQLSYGETTILSKRIPRATTQFFFPQGYSTALCHSTDTGTNGHSLRRCGSKSCTHFTVLFQQFGTKTGSIEHKQAKEKSFNEFQPTEYTC